MRHKRFRKRPDNRRATMRSQMLAKATAKAKGGPVDPALVEAWQWLMTDGAGDPDPKSPDYGATVYQFLASLKIKDEKSHYVDFILRPKQKLILDLREDAWAAGEVFKAICLKTRRYGITTFKLGCAVERLLRSPGWIGLTVAKDSTDAKKFMRTVREFLNQIPVWARPETVRQDRQIVGFRHGAFQESSLALLSANNEGGLGRGDTLNGLHPTEPPHYRAAAKAEFSSVQPSLGDFPGNEEFHESTAKGFDAMFYPLWEAAHWPGEVSASRFQRIFIASYEHPNFYRPFKSNEEMEGLADAIGTDPKFGEKKEAVYYHDLILPYQASDDLPHGCLGSDPEDRRPQAVRRRALEQINYMRTVQEDKCARSFSRRCQEYPVTPNEAFISTGTPFFDGAMIDGWTHRAREDHDALSESGGFHYTRGSVTWKPDPVGLWVMRHQPQVGFSYCSGTDTASGKKRQDEAGRSGDYSVTFIGEVATGFVACYLQAHVDSRVHAWEYAKASYYYGKSPGLAERSVVGDSGTFIVRVERAEVAGWEAYESLLYTTRMISGDHGPVWKKEVGFASKKNTKRPLCTSLQDFFNVEMGDPIGATKRPEIPLVCLEEMRYFDEDDQGELGATKGFDDTVIAMALMLEARELVRADVSLQTKVEVSNYDPEAEMWERIWDSQAKQEAKGFGNLGKGW